MVFSGSWDMSLSPNLYTNSHLCSWTGDKTMMLYLLRWLYLRTDVLRIDTEACKSRMACLGLGSPMLMRSEPVTQNFQVPV